MKIEPCLSRDAHHGVRKFVGSYWIKRKWGRPLIFAYFFLWASKGKSKWTKRIWFRNAMDGVVKGVRTQKIAAITGL